MSEGLVYIAIGSKFFEEAMYSADSVKRQMPHLPIKIFTDQNKESPVFDLFQEIKVDRTMRYDKSTWLSRSPFEKTIFLDTDTLVVSAITELFEILDRFDIAAAHAPYRRSHDWSPTGVWNMPGTPDCFSEFNTGVIAYRLNTKTKQLLRLWKKYYDADAASLGGARTPDQPSFCKSIYESDVNCYVLTPEYNCRFIFPTTVCGKVKILHGRSTTQSLEEIVQNINNSEDLRAYIPKSEKKRWWKL